MPVPFPQYDLPEITGGADLWDEPQASVVLLDDYFSSTATGSVAATEADDTSSASGTVSGGGITGTVAVTEADDTPTTSGRVRWVATVAVTEDNDTSAASGVVRIIGTISTTEDTDTCSAVGEVVGAEPALPQGASSAAYLAKAGRRPTPDERDEIELLLLAVARR